VINMTASTEPTADDAAVEALVGRLLNAGVETLELANIYLGHTLGLYTVLAAAAPLTAADLATRSALDERYVREWLQAQAVSGFVTVGPDETYALAPGVREVLVDNLSPAYLAPLGQLTAALGNVFPDLVAAFRTGEGVPYSAYGPEAVSAQAALNRPAYANDLVPTWLPALPDLNARLADTVHPARVADLGCGAGWASIELAKAFPHLRIDGLDADAASIAAARRNAAAQGVADQIRFEVRDLAAPSDDPDRYDVTLLFECLHDMAYPDRVLRNVRRQTADDGWVIVMDEAVDEELIAPSDDPIQRYFANASPLWCLPQGRPAPDAHPVGTVMRPAALRALATEAGFEQVEVLPIEHPFWRFYRLRQPRATAP
jgi:SAM-dependent methyltransferase